MDEKYFYKHINSDKIKCWWEEFERFEPFSEELSKEGFMYHAFSNNKYLGTYKKMPLFCDIVVISDMEGNIYKDGKKIGLKIDLSHLR